LSIGGATHLVTEKRDSFGRSTGYTYAKDDVVQQTASTGYGADGRIASAGFEHDGEEKSFSYGYLSGSNLLQTLAMPNGVTLTQTYEVQRDLLTGMTYATATGTLAQRSYAYDNIGNRTLAVEGADATAYETNNLNQYTSVSENGEDAFVPHFDADGNQTLIKTSTGIWSAVYNAENRPMTFTNSTASTIVECAYDRMGRRCFKKVTVNGTVTLHECYIYRGYLQIAAVNLLDTAQPLVHTILWDSTQPDATRSLAICKGGSWHTYGWDLTKNVCELFVSTSTLDVSYAYTPYGTVTANGDIEQPIQWSGECVDSETGMVSFVHRHYNTNGGLWIDRDLINDGYNPYRYANNNPVCSFDLFGLLIVEHYTSLEAVKGILEYGYSNDFLWTGEADSIPGDGIH